MTGDRKKIIAVDDNPENLLLLKNTLKESYTVFPNPSAQDMFELLEHVRPDLIMLDVEMPGMNGYEAIKQLKSNDKNREIPVIFLTSMSDAQSEMEGLKLGAVDYISKPFVTPLLLRRIKTHISVMEHKREIEDLLVLKTQEVKLREMAEQAAQNASHARSNFLSRMSHEIRSPLNAVIGMINIANEENDIPSLKAYLAKAGAAAKQVLSVINNILDMSKIEANKYELSDAEFDFGKMMSNIVDLTGSAAPEKHQNITLNINPNVPSFIICDELRLTQIINNLMNNALNFTPENGKIQLSAEKLDEKDGRPPQAGEITIKIEIEDSGIGISPEQQKTLFTAYNQADNAVAKNFGGTGLGLFIAKRIVELMRGTIHVESELGKGAKFIFTIKAKQGTQAAVKTAFSGTDIKAADLNLKDYTILVAEDMDFNREVISKYLEKTAVTIDFAENGKIAVEKFKANPDKYKLIFMDINMPEMNGDEAAKIIRALDLKRAKEIPIIAMTADVYKEDIEKCLAAGMNDHIAKPVVPKIVLAKLKQYIEQ
ncbi:MAG: response regulator [Treponema sp.]|jgi:signal transduction histidine kinase|nr:response regulator [Treponema sp.]